MRAAGSIAPTGSRPLRWTDGSRDLTFDREVANLQNIPRIVPTQPEVPMRSLISSLFQFAASIAVPIGGVTAKPAAVRGVKAWRLWVALVMSAALAAPAQHVPAQEQEHEEKCDATCVNVEPEEETWTCDIIGVLTIDTNKGPVTLLILACERTS